LSDETAPGAPRGHYGSVAMLLHWIVFALAVGVVGLGWVLAGTPRGSLERAQLLLIHRSLGLSIGAVMMLRLVWRWRHPPPPLLAVLGRFEIALARLTHAALYLFFIAMPLAGYINAAAEGHAVSLFGIAKIPPLLPQDERLSQLAVAAHLVGQYVIYLFVLFHVASALYHSVRRDGVAGRMLPVRRGG
jgi:cytochrome b561